MVGVAALLHITTLFTWIVYGSAFAQRAELFSHPPDLTVAEVTLAPPQAPTRPGAKKPRSPSPGTPKAANTPRVTVRPTASSAAPTRPNAAPRAAAAAIDRAAPRRGGPRVVAVHNGGPATAAPDGGGARDGRGSDSSGAMGNGNGNATGGTGGTTGAGGGDGDGEGVGVSPGQYPLWMRVEYTRNQAFNDLVTHDVNLSEKQEPRSWDDLCAIADIAPAALRARPHVSPFLTRLRYLIRTVEERKTLVGRRGTVNVHIEIDPTGTPRVSLLRGSGDALLDSTALFCLAYSRWLPALDYGTPVGDVIDMAVSFSDEAGTSTGITLSAGPGNGQAGLGGMEGRPPVTVPGGAGQAPTGTPGGAGQRPGSW